MDCLSRYYEDGGGKTAPEESVEWANTDAQLDFEGDNLLHDRWQELHLSTMTTWGKCPRQPDKMLDKPRETQSAEADEMAAHTERSEEDNPIKDSRGDPNLLQSASNSPDLPRQLQDNEGLQAAITVGYQTDPVLSKVWDNPGHHAAF